MKKVRFGVVGTGNQGNYYAVSLLASGGIESGELTALCDIDAEKLKAVSEKAREKSGREVATFTDYKEMVNSGLVDAVLVETPHYSHPEIVMYCLGRGVHALTDKPAGVYAAQVREMNEAAKKSKALFGMMFNQRTNCVYRKMREIVASGGIGKLQRVNWIITNWYRTQYYYDTGDWRATWAGEGGGVLINQSPHQLDLVQWVVGERPVSVRGFCKYGKWRNIEVEDEVTAYFEYASGASGVFITTTGEAPGANRFEISGTKGKLLCENDKLFYTKLAEDSIEFGMREQNGFRRPASETTEVETDGQNTQHAGIIENFSRAILGKEKLFVPGEEGIFGVELMNAIEYSGWHDGMRVPLPPDEKAYLDELDAHRASSRSAGKRGSSLISDVSGSFGNA